MRALAAAGLLLIAASAGADSSRRSADVDVIVPVEPREHHRLHFFGRRDHHLVPGTVTINATPYVCDLDGKRFRDRDAFVAHIQAAHHTEPRRISELLLVRDDVVHFVGE